MVRTLLRAIPACRLLLLMLPAIGTSAWAQDVEMAPTLPVPPRVSIVEGAASFWRPGDADWSPAQVNMPLAAGDALFAGDGATVEVQIGPRAYLRLMARTQVEVVRQEVKLVEMRLTAGTASFDLRTLAAGQSIRVDTPNAVLALDAGGYYRVSFDNGVSRLVVRRGGRATLGPDDGDRRAIVDGEQVVVRGPGGSIVEIAPAPPADSWDRWNAARSDYYDQAAANRYLPPDVYGGADLDQYGRWRELPEYGNVWMPDVPTGWAPFSTGVWRWDPVYQWTWIDQAPWGWATSHYGRWVYWNNRWVWAPGPQIARSVYLPAVVAFVGVAGSASFGWVALSWGEPIVPWWGPSGFRGHLWWGGWGGPRVVNNVVVRHGAEINVGTVVFGNIVRPRAVRAASPDAFSLHREIPSRELDFRSVERTAVVPYRAPLPAHHGPLPTTTMPPLRDHRFLPKVRPRLTPSESVDPGRGSVRMGPQPPTVEERRIELHQTVPAPRILERRKSRSQPAEPALEPQQRPATGTTTIRRSTTEAPARELHSIDRQRRSTSSSRDEDERH